MLNLPWKLIITKGLIKAAELIFLDVLQYPSLKVVNFVRDDVIMVFAFIFYGLSLENVRVNY